jgi:hypothetical protein
MNDLLEMLEMKKKLDQLIEESVDNLTMNEVQMLTESGVLNELNIKNGIGALSKLSKRIAGSSFGQKVAASKTGQKAIGFGKDTKRVTTKFAKNVMGGDKLKQAQLKRKIAKADRSMKAAGIDQSETKHFSQMSGPEADKYIAAGKLRRIKKNVNQSRKTLATHAGATAVGGTVVGAGVKKSNQNRNERNQQMMAKAAEAAKPINRIKAKIKSITSKG